MSETFELIKQRIELTESYHTTKEKMAWLGSTVYYGLCLTVISIILNLDRDLNLAEGIIFLAVSLILFIGALVFINLQFRMRWLANDTTAAVNKILKNYPKNYSVTQYMNDFDKKLKECSRKRCKGQILMATILLPLFWRIFRMESEYRTEIPAYGIAVYLFIAKVLIVTFHTYWNNF